MKRWVVGFAVVAALCVAYPVAHCALIETGREVIVLRTEEPDGAWYETRLWIVDDGATPWLHGGDSRWMRNLRERPLVEVARGGETHRYRATPVPGPHPRVDELLRAKYGIADRWVRFVAPDGPSTAAVRLERLPTS
jgi:hypothetical protein